jgi:alkanesulfonate monooxygenase SsuD/methylene tetrahydromethanopterin reductase-like flavin-dependent oxidoreductase (luciferase family)
MDNVNIQVNTYSGGNLLLTSSPGWRHLIMKLDSFNIVPMWYPLRLAEDYAIADILTGGRVIFGVGRGYHPREVETFGAPLTDQNANREMFEEGVEILFKAFEGKPFSHKGKYYTIPPEVPYRGYTLKEITLVPAPERLPVECWQPIQSGSDRAFDFMARHGISGVIGGGSAEGGAVERHMLAFQAAYARRGIRLELGERLALGYQFHIASSRQQAIREAAPHYEENMKMFRRIAPRAGADRRADRGDARPPAC